jgi:hypothetical protein
MRTMRLASLGILGLALAGCYAYEPDYRRVGARPHEWDLPGPEIERKVFGPIPADEVKDFVREKESDGWQVEGYEPASLPEDVMVHSTELDVPAPSKRRWSPDLPKTMDDRLEAPKKTGIPPYLDQGVKPHRQKYLVILRRWI